MKKTTLLWGFVLCGLSFSACSEDGLSVAEYCQKILECNSQAYASASACESQINQEIQNAPDCLDDINTYHECVINGVCNGKPDAMNTCDKTEVNYCKATHGYSLK